MSHYWIKCVRCAHEANNDTVLFDVEDTVQSATAMLSEQNSGMTVGGLEEDKKSKAAGKGKEADSGFWSEQDGEETNESNTQEAKAEKHVVKGKLMTYPMMKKYYEENDLGEVRPQYQHVNVTPDFLEEGLFDPESELLTGMWFESEENGVGRLANKRFCPVCKHALPNASGAMPTYNVTLMGATESGKTVYLCELSKNLTEASFGLPYRGVLSCAYASNNGSTIKKLADAMHSTGELPGTTQALLNDPLVLQMTFSIGGRVKNCLLALADMRGEDFTLGGGENLLVRAEQFSKADGFMVVINPRDIPDIGKCLPVNQSKEKKQAENREDNQAEKQEKKRKVHANLISSIQQYICPFMPSREITKPSVIMLSQCDLLKRYVESLDEMSSLRVKFGSNPVIAREPKIRYTGTYFNAYDRGTREMLRMDSGLAGFLNTTFKDSYYTAVSSLGESEVENGKVPSVSEGGRGIAPIRVVDPVIHLLMSFGFLPEYTKMEATPPQAVPVARKRLFSGHKQEEREPENEKKNREILSEWMETHT